MHIFYKTNFKFKCPYRVCISKVSEAAGLKTVDKKRKVEKNVLRAIADEPRMQYAGTNVNLNISSSKLTLISLETNQVIASHDMPRISFASGGDSVRLFFSQYAILIVYDVTNII